MAHFTARFDYHSHFCVKYFLKPRHQDLFKIIMSQHRTISPVSSKFTRSICENKEQLTMGAISVEWNSYIEIILTR
jgi:hypothetical protein